MRRQRPARRTRYKSQLTVNNVHFYPGGIRVARLAHVDPGVARHGFLDHQTARCFGPLLGDEADTAARRIEIDNLDKITQVRVCSFFKRVMELHALRARSRLIANDTQFQIRENQ